MIDIGINNPVENYLAALEEQAGYSRHVCPADHDHAYMKVVIDAMKEKVSATIISFWLAVRL